LALFFGQRWYSLVFESPDAQFWLLGRSADVAESMMQARTRARIRWRS
jgi:hypothetical protein